MNTITVDSLKEGLTFTGDLFIDSTFLILPKSGDVTKELIKALKTWNVEVVLCDGGMSLGGDIGVNTFPETEESGDNKERIGDSIREIINNSKDNSSINNEQARIEMVEKVYAEYMDYIESIFTHYATHKEIDQEELSETVRDLCIFIKEHRRYILRVNSSPDPRDKNFLVLHSMRTTVLAIAIGQQLHLPLSKMVELGVTCLIHEIGMLQLPPQLYMKTKKLTPGEKAQISKHTLYGYSMVKELNFPLSVQLGVLEHHEKENGTGYPRRLTGDKISSNAKIISVACSYEAISSPRSYRDERSTFDALIEMIQNEDNQYDNTILKALLYTVSLYPIGTYVFLSNRKIAVVIDSNPDNPKEPIVQMLTEREPDGSLKTFQIGTNELTILRILSKEEKKDMIPAAAEIRKEESKIIAKEKAENKKAVQEEVQNAQSNSTPQTPTATVDTNTSPAEPSAPSSDNDSSIVVPSENSINPDGTENIDISVFS